VRLLATLAVRDEMRFLPGWLSNVPPQVDGVVALDDGSSDGSAELLEAHPKVLEVLRVPRDRPRWDEVSNHRALVAAASGHGADWIVALDADERLEREFRVRAERAIASNGSYLGYRLILRELWDSTATYRADGIWAQKTPARLFRAMADHAFDYSPLHAEKAPGQARINGSFPSADIVIYHLRMIDAQDRRARRERYERWDPEALLQKAGVGYAYLTDETDLALEPVPPSRGFDEGSRYAAAP
jgi:glycosyltransferase involved in cell wall biosynthesis